MTTPLAIFAAFFTNQPNADRCDFRSGRLSADVLRVGLTNSDSMVSTTVIGSGEGAPADRNADEDQAVMLITTSAWPIAWHVGCGSRRFAFVGPVTDRVAGDHRGAEIPVEEPDVCGDEVPTTTTFHGHLM